ncbi:MAG: histidine triad nucleotide-binding protein [Mahellales bacterium]|jgi:histidine triad (HIT) family protein
MSDCIFCSIVKGTIPTQIEYEDDRIMVFKDINPQAPIHFLLIPKQHFDSLMEVDSKDGDIIAHIYMVAKNIARQRGFDRDGFRIVMNCGQDGGQTVQHIHFHLLAGRSLQWPPG